MLTIKAGSRSIINKIIEFYTSIYKARLYSNALHKYTKADMRRNVKNVVSIFGKTFQDSDLKNTIIPSWKNQGYFEIQYKNWHFAVVAQIDIFGNNIAIVQDCCHNKDYHNDMMQTQPFVKDSPNDKSDLVDWKLYNIKNLISEQRLHRIIVESVDRLLSENMENEMTKVYHGSTAKFDKFNTSFMSTGEGSQVHGWGIYVTVSEKTGRKYACPFGKSRRKTAYFYEAEIPDNDGTNYLEEESPINAVILNNITDTYIQYCKDNRKKSGKRPLPLETENRIREEMSNLKNGVELYDYLADDLCPKTASYVLGLYGFKGIHYFGYLDGESYVIFNPDDIQILNRSILKL